MSIWTWISGLLVIIIRMITYVIAASCMHFCQVRFHVILLQIYLLFETKCKIRYRIYTWVLYFWEESNQNFQKTCAWIKMKSIKHILLYIP
jgi:hypothetical protein